MWRVFVSIDCYTQNEQQTHAKRTVIIESTKICVFFSATQSLLLPITHDTAKFDSVYKPNRKRFDEFINSYPRSLTVCLDIGQRFQNADIPWDIIANRPFRKIDV